MDWRILRKSSLAVDEWIELVALNRLTGHSPGFFSVYTMPPNQAVTVEKQLQFNQKRNQTPPPRDVPGLILKKTRALLSDWDPVIREHLAQVALRSMLLTKPASRTPEIPDNSVALVVTSPPFLDVVDYATDNWLRCWFLGIDAKSLELTVPSKLTDWHATMTEVFRELHHVLRPGGHVAFEVGEVRNGTVKLEEIVIPCGAGAGLEPLLALINQQRFTKTANCWGVDNNTKGTNTNRAESLYRHLLVERLLQDLRLSAHLQAERTHSLRNFHNRSNLPLGQQAELCRRVGTARYSDLPCVGLRAALKDYLPNERDYENAFDRFEAV